MKQAPIALWALLPRRARLSLAGSFVAARGELNATIAAANSAEGWAPKRD